MWQQQQVSDFAEKLVISFFFFGFLCYGVCTCIYLCVCVCVKRSVAVFGVCLSCVELLQYWSTCVFGGVFHWCVLMSGPALYWLLQTHFAAG